MASNQDIEELVDAALSTPLGVGGWHDVLCFI